MVLNRCLALVAAGYVSLCCSSSLFALNFTWNGQNNSGNPKNQWGQSGNWTIGILTPSANDTIYMQGTARTLNEVDVGAWQTINGLTFSNSTATFTIFGAALTNGAIGITNFQNNQVTISNTFVLGASQTWYSPSNTLLMAGPVDLQANTLTVSDSASITNKITGIVSGTGTITKSGNGRLELSGVNTYSGITTINGGTVAISADSGLGTSPGSATATQITLGGGTLASTATFTLNSNRGITLNAGGGSIDVASGTTLTYNGAIAGASGNDLTKTGTGTLVIGGANTYSGATTISAGTLQLGAANVMPDTTAVTISSGATFDLNEKSETVGSLAGAGTLQFGGGAVANSFTAGGDNSNTTFSGVINSTSDTFDSFYKAGTGTLTLSGPNTFKGIWTIYSGAISIAADSGLGTSPSSAVANELTLGGIGGGTLKTTATFTLNSNRGITLSTGGGAFDVAAGTTLTYNGIIAGGATLGLTKKSTGTLVLGGANTFTGNITNSAGNIDVQNASALGGAGTKTLQINGGSVIFSVGYTNTSLNVTLNSGAISNNNVDISLGTLTLSANSTINLYKDSIVKTNRFNDTAFTAGNVVTINNWTGTAGQSGTDDRLFFTSNTGGNNFLIYSIQFTGYNAGAVRLSTGEIVPIPEPGTMAGALLMISLFAQRFYRKSS